MAYQHIYLSPHLDDAVLSCGGTIARQVALGQPVLVVNVFAGIPDYARLSDFARELHAQWGLGPDPVAARRAEDAAVLASLGAAVENWEYPDCIYRGREDLAFYPARDDIFGAVHPDEADLLFRIAARFAQLNHRFEHAVFFAPIGAGHHVDHQIVRAAAVALDRLAATVLFYEDFPYAGGGDTLHRAKAELGPAGWEQAVAPIDVDAKIRAVAGYTSQIEVLFGDTARMAEQVRAYARSVMEEDGEGDEDEGHGERFWRLL